MAAKEDMGRWQHLAAIEELPTADKEAFEVLHHPWRVRILEVLSERDMSCAQVIDEGWIPELLELDRSEAIPKLAYHFRVLRKVGAIEVVEKNQKRGSTELVCRGRARAYFSTDEWAKLPRATRCMISRTVLQGLMARAEGALVHDTFDERIDRHLVWAPMELDEQGWSEMAALLDGVAEAAVHIGPRPASALRTAARSRFARPGASSTFSRRRRHRRAATSCCQPTFSLQGDR
jgi:DNA-binding transcriptional ArsR family regulator